jgi:hypothetical protein
MKNEFNGLIEFITAVFSGDWSKAWEAIKNIFESRMNGIKGIISSVWSFMKNIFNSLVNLARSVGNTIWNIVKGVINLITSGINVLIRGLNKISFKAPDWVPGLGGKSWGINIPQIPRLKVGGIINMPGRGIPLGGAIGGEAGAEGVLPLTDSQAMETLGEAIGRYIKINANITNMMNGRVISRQIQQIIANQDFAYNS